MPPKLASHATNPPVNEHLMPMNKRRMEEIKWRAALVANDNEEGVKRSEFFFGSRSIVGRVSAHAPVDLILGPG